MNLFVDRVNAGQFQNKTLNIQIWDCVSVSPETNSKNFEQAISQISNPLLNFTVETEGSIKNPKPSKNENFFAGIFESLAKNIFVKSFSCFLSPHLFFPSNRHYTSQQFSLHSLLF